MLNGKLKIISIILLFYAIHGFSKPRIIKVVSPEFQNFTEKNGHGVYWQILKEIYKKEGFKLVFENLPYSRAQYLLQKKKIDIVLAAYIDEFPGVIYPDKSYPLDRDEVSVIYLKDSSIAWNGIGSLAGSRVGWQRGYGYKKYIDADFLHYEVSNSAQAIAMIRLERLDFFMDSKTEIEILLNSAHNIEDNYHKKNIFKIDLFPAFRADAKGRDLIKTYERNIEKMRRSGYLRKLYEKYGVSYTLSP